MAERNPRYGSVQALLPLDEIRGDVLCLRGGEYRAVLEASSVNFALKSESEQEAILAGYRSLLNSLTFPIQVLVRVVPTDVERYLTGLDAGQTLGAALARLALDHEAFVRRLARQRTLLERRFYIVVPAELSVATARPPMFPRRRRDGSNAQHGLAVAAQQLALRCQELVQRLAGFGVAARRLTGEEMAALWYMMLTSELARIQPLARAPWPVAVIAQHNREVKYGR